MKRWTWALWWVAQMGCVQGVAARNDAGTLTTSDREPTIADVGLVDGPALVEVAIVDVVVPDVTTPDDRGARDLDVASDATIEGSDGAVIDAVHVAPVTHTDAGVDGGTTPADCSATMAPPDVARPPAGTCVVAPLSPEALSCGCGACPTAAAWEVRCNEYSWGFTAAAADDGRGYALLSNSGYGDHKQLVTFDPGGGSSVAADPFVANTQLLMGPSRLSAVLCGPDGSVHLVSELGPGLNLAHFTRRDGAWSAEDVTPGGTPRPYFDDAIIDPLGQVRVLSHVATDLTFTLATRSPDGSWSRSAVPGTIGASLATDLAGEPYILRRLERLGGDDYAYQRVGSPPVVLTRLPSGPAGGGTMIVPSDHGAPGAPLVTLALSESELHLFLAGPSGLRDVPISAGESVTHSDCPSMTSTGFMPPTGCREGATCHAQGVGPAVSHHALAQTRDGRVWLGYLRLHTDREFAVTPRCGREFCSCDLSLVSARDGAEAVIEEVDPRTGAHAVRYRLPISVHADIQGFTLQGRGDHLHVAASGFPSTDNSDVRLRYVVVDVRTSR